MYPILEKQDLAPAIRLMVVEAPNAARKARAGQFVIVRIDETGERIPLTIADHDAARGTVTLIFQEVGKSTLQMGTLEVGDSFATVAGPLGHPTEIAAYGTVVCVGGGVGIAPIFPIARALKEAGNRVISIIGARSHNLLFWEDRMRSVSDELIVCTDDGSAGIKGLVTEGIRLALSQHRDIDECVAIGPPVMMKGCAEATRSSGIRTIVSLNPVMVDGTGMCGGCRVKVGETVKFACVDGPDFDGHRVDFDDLMFRLQRYRATELAATERFNESCRMRSLTAQPVVAE